MAATILNCTRAVEARIELKLATHDEVVAAMLSATRELMLSSRA